MTAKYYFRQLALQNFGYPADTKVVELKNYLEENLKNLTAFTDDDIQDHFKSKIHYLVEIMMVNIDYLILILPNIYHSYCILMMMI